jgi:hypothetical protein
MCLIVLRKDAGKMNRLKRDKIGNLNHVSCGRSIYVLNYVPHFFPARIQKVMHAEIVDEIDSATIKICKFQICA